jgi:hypothetical protein
METAAAGKNYINRSAISVNTFRHGLAQNMFTRLAKPARSAKVRLVASAF